MREYELFLDGSYYDMWCVRDVSDKDFESDKSFHFALKEDAELFLALINKAK